MQTEKTKTNNEFVTISCLACFSEPQSSIIVQKLLEYISNPHCGTGCHVPSLQTHTVVSFDSVEHRICISPIDLTAFFENY